MRDMQSAWMTILQASRRPSDHQAYSIKELKRLGQIKLQKTYYRHGSIDTLGRENEPWHVSWHI